MKATVKLDRIDLEYLLARINDNIEKGWCYGNPNHFFKRLYKLRETIINALRNMPSPCEKIQVKDKK